MDDMGITQQDMFKGQGDAIKAAADAAAEAAKDPLREAMEKAGTTSDNFLRAYELVAGHAGRGGEQLPGVLSREERMADPAFIGAAKQLLPQVTPQKRAAIEAMLGGVSAFANGGMSQGGLALVGERGPELVSLPGGSRVHPNGSGPGGGMTFHFHGAVYGVDDLQRVVVEAVRDHAISGGFAGVFAEA